MTYLEYSVKRVPAGLAKVFYLDWGLVVLLVAVASIGFLMLYSIAGGSLQPWAEPQMMRFAVGLVMMFVVAFVPIWFWRNMAALAYALSLLLLIAVDLFGVVGMGARRWIDLGFFRLQPSELAKITMVMALAAYYDWLPLRRTSHPLWVLCALVIVIVPAALVLRQPDLGTALLLVLGGGAVMFLAGVHWLYFAVVIAGAGGLVAAVLASRGTEWQLLADYQFRRIDSFLDPTIDPLGTGYHINQSMIALGSGGWSGRGFMEGTQSRLNFLPEKHTDFIFTTLAEEFGFVGGVSLLALYMLIVTFGIVAALKHLDRFAMLLTLGVTVTFFLYFATNMAMVMGLAQALTPEQSGGFFDYAGTEIAW